MPAQPVPRKKPVEQDQPWYEDLAEFAVESAKFGARTILAGQVAKYTALASAGDWLWETVQGDFNRNPTTGQIIVGGIISLIPIVDQACDVRDVVANCIALSEPADREDYAKWIALGLTCIGFVPEAGSAVKTVGKCVHRNGSDLLGVLKQMEWLESLASGAKTLIPWGRAPLKWLRQFDWQKMAKEAAAGAKKAFQEALRRAQAALRYAAGAVARQLQKLIDTFRAINDRVVQVMQDIASVIQGKLETWFPSAKQDAGNFDAKPGGPNKHKQNDKEPDKDSSQAVKVGRVATEPGTAFFWSGRTNGVGGQDVAADIAKKHDGVTLEMLIEERGIDMPAWNPNDPASVEAWEKISEEYANGVSGEVRAVIGDNLRPGNIWQNRELPALMGNPSVTKITTIDPVTKVAKIIYP